MRLFESVRMTSAIAVGFGQVEFRDSTCLYGQKPDAKRSVPESRFPAIYECRPRMGEDDPFGPRRISSYARRLQRLAVIPGHPLRGVGRQFPRMALQLRKVIKRVGAI